MRLPPCSSTGSSASGWSWLSDGPPLPCSTGRTSLRSAWSHKGRKRPIDLWVLKLQQAGASPTGGGPVDDRAGDRLGCRCQTAPTCVGKAPGGCIGQIRAGVHLRTGYLSSPRTDRSRKQVEFGTVLSLAGNGVTALRQLTPTSQQTWFDPPCTSGSRSASPPYCDDFAPVRNPSRKATNITHVVLSMTKNAVLPMNDMCGQSVL
jgi:hypothetical protein